MFLVIPMISRRLWSRSHEWHRGRIRYGKVGISSNFAAKLLNSFAVYFEITNLLCGETTFLMEASSYDFFELKYI